jgi:hypothetical protein
MGPLDTAHAAASALRPLDYSLKSAQALVRLKADTTYDGPWSA